MRAGCALAAVAVCWLWAQPGFGQAAGDRLLAIEPLPDGVSDRIAGQTADLAWTIDRAAMEAHGVPAATRLAAEHHARAVLWVSEDASGFVLRLFDVRKRRVLERKFAREGRGALARSAAMEAMALSLRSSLRALSAEEDVGQEVGENAAIGGEGTGGSGNGDGDGDEHVGRGDGDGHGKGGDAHAHGDEHVHANEHVHEHESESASESGSESESESASGSWSPGMAADATALILAGGWGGALDGQSPVQHGPWARVGVGFGRFEIAAGGAIGLAADIHDDEATLRVRRSDLLASGAFAFLQGARAHAAVAVDLGVASFARETRIPVTSALTATHPASTQSFALGVELRGAVQLVSSRTFALELELSAGLLLLPAAPVLRYEGANGRVEHALWLVQPQLQLGPRIRLGT